MCTSIFLKRIIAGILAVRTVISVSYQSKIIAGVNPIRMVVSRASTAAAAVSVYDHVVQAHGDALRRSALCLPRYTFVQNA